VILRSLPATALIVVGLFVVAWPNGDTSASASPSPSPSKRPKLASFKERLAAAQSVKIQTAILGIELDSTLESAHSQLDSLGRPSGPPDGADETGERNEGEHKISWQLAKTDYASVFVKTDEKKHITYVAGYLRPGKEMPFDKIGQLEKAPVLSDRVVAWDVVRPNRPLIRVVARGSERKANSITMFIVKRPRTD
jgi:hypothetical protein